MAKWYVDVGLNTLNAQLREMFPGITIWSIGDLDHQERVSDHNPEEDGSVDASDYPLTKAFSKEDAEWLFNRQIAIKDSRFAYAIWNRKIVSSTVRPWVVRDYTGVNPHTGLLHLSVNDKHENDRSLWKLAEKMRDNSLELDGLYLPVVKFGENDSVYGGFDMVRRIQKLVGVTVDGVYGAETAAAVKRTVGGGDGRVVGFTEWKRLYGLTAD